MQGTPAIYLGKIVDKSHFRVFIYSPNGNKKLVESWDEFERHMAMGIWFATAKEAENYIIPLISDDVDESIEILKQSKKPGRKPKAKA